MIVVNEASHFCVTCRLLAVRAIATGVSNGSHASVERRLTTAKHPLFLQHRWTRKWNDKCFRAFLGPLPLPLPLPLQSCSPHIVAFSLPRIGVCEFVRVTGHIRM
jgi:hypothetical protein